MPRKRKSKAEVSAARSAAALERWKGTTKAQRSKALAPAHAALSSEERSANGKRAAKKRWRAEKSKAAV